MIHICGPCETPCGYWRSAEDNPVSRWSDDLCETKLDYGLAALMITGIVLLILGACIQQGYLPLPGTVANFTLGFGGGFFGIGGFLLLVRGCCNR